MQKELLLLIPAYNEEESIGLFLKKLLNANVSDYADILVIDDASQDATFQIVSEMGIRIIHHPYNLGYGMALQTGYKYGVKQGYSYIIQIDSDGQHDVCNIPIIYDCLKNTDTDTPKPDLVIGSRFLEGSRSFPLSFPKKAAIAFFSKVIQLTARQTITDPTSGLQGLSYPVFEYYSHFGNFDSNYPDANMIVQMTLLGYRIREIPAVMHERCAGQSMHFGIIKPLLYMFVMIFSTTNVYLRNKWKLLPQPHYDKGGTDFEKQ